MAQAKEQESKTLQGVLKHLNAINLNELPQPARHSIREAKHLIINHTPQS